MLDVKFFLYSFLTETDTKRQGLSEIVVASGEADSRTLSLLQHYINVVNCH